MASIITFHSSRGGTGKSTIAVNVAAGLTIQGKRVALVDTDLQCPGLHLHLGLTEYPLERTLNDYLTGRRAITEVAYDVSGFLAQERGTAASGTIYLLPASQRSREMARVLRDGYSMDLLNEGFRTLVEQLSLDFLGINTPPGLQEEALLGMGIADTLAVILRPERKDFQGTAVTVDVARRLEIPHLFLVVNQVLSTYDPVQVRDRVERTYRCPVAAVLGLFEEVADLGSAGLFSLRYPEHPFSQGIAEIVARVEGQAGAQPICAPAWS